MESQFDPQYPHHSSGKEQQYYRIQESRVRGAIRTHKIQLVTLETQFKGLRDNFLRNKKRLLSQLELRRHSLGSKERQEILEEKQKGVSYLTKLLHSYSEEQILDKESLCCLKDVLKGEKDKPWSVEEEDSQILIIKREIQDNEGVLEGLEEDEARLAGRIEGLRSKIAECREATSKHLLPAEAKSKEDRMVKWDSKDLKEQLRVLTLKYLPEQRKQEELQGMKEEIIGLERWNHEVQTSILAINYREVEAKKTLILQYKQQIERLQQDIVKHTHQESILDEYFLLSGSTVTYHYHTPIDPLALFGCLLLTTLLIWTLL